MPTSQIELPPIPKWFGRHWRINLLPVSQCKLPKNLDNLMHNETYDSLFMKAGDKYGIDWRIIKGLSLSENEPQDPNAISPNGMGVGLMQVNPTAWNYSIEQLQNPEFNIDVGTAILKRYLDKYTDLETAIRVYKGYSSTNPKWSRQWVRFNTLYQEVVIENA